MGTQFVFRLQEGCVLILFCKMQKRRIFLHKIIILLFITNVKKICCVSFDIEGVVAPVFTPFDEGGGLALEVIPTYMKYLNDHGIKSILVGGTTGESLSLSLDERKFVAQAWLQEAKSFGAKVIVQVGGVPLPDVIQMAKFAEAGKADAIMTLPEIYYKPKSTEQLVSYLETVSEAAPTLPLLYYDHPMMSGVKVNATEFFNLASTRIPNFKGMKTNLEVATQIHTYLKDDQRVFIGNYLIAPAVLLGFESSITSATNIFPELVKRIVENVKTGDVVNARILQNNLNELVGSITQQGETLPTMKAAMEILTGIQVGPPRRPLFAIEEGHKDILIESLDKLRDKYVEEERALVMKSEIQPSVKSFSPPQIPIHVDKRDWIVPLV